MSSDPDHDQYVAPTFGTDGLRGRAGIAPMDPETMRRVAAALGLWLQRQGPEQKRVVIGNDGRDSANWILECLAQGLWCTEASVTDVGLCTTPSLAYLASTAPFAAGVMISASHNAATDNGIKIFDSKGDKLAPEAECEIGQLTSDLDLEGSRHSRIKDGSHLLDQYGHQLASRFHDLDLSGATIVVDAANGGGSELVPQILRDLGADVVTHACEPDGDNINHQCGALHPTGIIDLVKASAAVLGICLDGDGDRGIFVDDRGVVHDGDDLILTLAPHFHSCGRLPGDTAVTTVMSNLALRREMQSFGLALVMTPVGDRHVTARMRAEGFGLGAEQSGHVIIAQEGPWGGDGLAIALELLALPGTLTQGSSSVLRSFERYPQVLTNVAITSKPNLETIPGLAPLQQEIETQLAGEGRVFLRYSGTENLCRVLVEGPDQAFVQDAADRIVCHLSQHLGDA